MKKGSSFLVAIVLAAGLSSCGLSSRQASPPPTPTTGSIGLVHALPHPHLCRPQTMCME